ncbi:MAG: PA-phosphatase [Cellvibrio sp.]|nr:PA-phosphatase [Cellvibrio sp.]
MEKPTQHRQTSTRFLGVISRTNPVIKVLLWVGNRELPVLIVLFAIMASLWGFAMLTELALEDQPHELDRALLLSMRDKTDLSDPIGPGWVEEIGRDFTALGGNAVLILLTMAVIGFLLLDRKPRVVLVVLIATLGALTGQFPQWTFNVGSKHLPYVRCTPRAITTPQSHQSLYFNGVHHHHPVGGC